MALNLRRYQPWFLSIGAAGVVFVVLVMPGVDDPATSLAVTAGLAALAACVWIASSERSLAILLERKVAYVVGAVCLLALILSLEALMGEPRLTDVGVSLPFSENEPLEALRLVGLFVVFLLGVRLASNDDLARKLINALFVALTAWAFFSMVRLGYDSQIALDAQKLGAGRLAGGLSSPNSAGTLAAASSLFALTRVLGYFITARKPKLLDRIDVISAAAYLSCTAALMMTLSRSAIAIWGLGSLLIFVAMLWRKISVWWLLAICFIFLALTLGAFFSPIFAAVDRTRFVVNDAGIRSQIYQVHFHEAMRHPIIGHGLGSFDLVNKSIVSPANYKALWVIRAAHNVYLQWFEETGALGLMALFVLNIAILTPMAQAAFRPSRMRWRIIGILIFYAVFLIHGLTDYALQEPALEIVAALFLGCGFAMALNRRSQIPLS